MHTTFIASTLLVSLAACLAEPAPQELPATEVVPEDVARAVVAGPPDDCHGAPVAEPQSCTDFAWQCGAVNIIGVANDVLSQMEPGCDPWDGLDIVIDIVNTPDRDLTENLAIWACNVLECLPPSASSNPQVVAANAACAAGTVLATAIRCAALYDLCETERLNAQPICPGDNPCPYRPSVLACDGDAPRDQTDISRDCSAVVDNLGVSGPTHSSCMASCVATTIEGGAFCGSGPETDEPTEGQ